MNNYTELVIEWLRTDPQSQNDVAFFLGCYTEGVWCDIDSLAFMLESYSNTLAHLGMREGLTLNETQLHDVDWVKVAFAMAEDADD